MVTGQVLLTGVHSLGAPNIVLWVGMHQGVIRYIERGESTVRQRMGCTGAGSARTSMRAWSSAVDVGLSLASLRGIRNTGAVAVHHSRYSVPRPARPAGYGT